MTPRALSPLIALFLMAALWTGCGGGGNSRSETIATGDDPVALTFTPDGRLFFAEKYSGIIRVVGTDGNLVEQPFADIDVADWLNLDWGLTGLAVPPNFAESPYLYVFYTQPLPSSPEQPIAKPVLARFEASGNVAGPQETLIDDFEQMQLGHQGFRANGPAHFGADGMLYLSMGDYDYGKQVGPNGIPWALDPAQPIGKVLRVDPGGQVVGDSPFASDGNADGRVYAYGFANSRDFAIQPVTGAIFNSDATDSCEEINVVTAGGNYSWPDVGEFPFADCLAGPGTKGIYFPSKPDTTAGQFQSTVNIAGMAFLTGDKYPSLGEGLLICEKVTGRLRLLTLGGANGQEVTADSTIVEDCAGSVAVGTDGLIYYTNATEVKRVKPDEE